MKMNQCDLNFMGDPLETGLICQKSQNQKINWRH